jgi:hypothetical protein
MAATVAPAREYLSRQVHPDKRLPVKESAKRKQIRGESTSLAKLVNIPELGRREKPRHPTAKSKGSLRGKRSDPSLGANAQPKAGAVPVEKVPTRKGKLAGVSAPCPACRSRQRTTELGIEASLDKLQPENGRSGPAMRPKPSLAAKSSVGEFAARESESAQRKYPAK